MPDEELMVRIPLERYERLLDADMRNRMLAFRLAERRMTLTVVDILYDLGYPGQAKKLESEDEE